jgi:hypothetical protein
MTRSAGMNRQVSDSPDPQLSSTNLLCKFGVLQKHQRIGASLGRRLPGIFEGGGKLFPDLGGHSDDLHSIIQSRRKTAQIPERSLWNGRIDYRRRGRRFTGDASRPHETGR